VNPARVRIVGGGLFGLTTAIQLARRGVDVEVFERRSARGTAPELRCDAVENWTTADDLGALLPSWGIEATAFHALRRRRPLLYLVKRGGDPGCLDRALEQQALGLGVRICHGQTLPLGDTLATPRKGPRGGKGSFPQCP
jgi:2-polyprenyl-6-methoxyphenol hydroxylase-like FAD-dependent oxidoreductase